MFYEEFETRVEVRNCDGRMEMDMRSWRHELLTLYGVTLDIPTETFKHLPVGHGIVRRIEMTATTPNPTHLKISTGDEVTVTIIRLKEAK